MLVLSEPPIRRGRAFWWVVLLQHSLVDWGESARGGAGHIAPFEDGKRRRAEHEGVDQDDDSESNNVRRI